MELDSGDEKIVDSLMIGSGADTDDEENAALFLAVKNGDEKIAKLLINGANISATDEESMTPLHWAAFNGHKHIVELLIKNSANVNSQAKIDGNTPLLKAAENEHLEIAELLIDSGANVNQGNIVDMVPLHWAVITNNFEMMKLLTERGADVNHADNDDGNTALLFAAEYGRERFVDFLLKNGANVNHKNIYRTTALHNAACFDDTKVALLLIENGANINAVDNQGATPLIQAEEDGLKEMVDLLATLGNNGAQEQ